LLNSGRRRNGTILCDDSTAVPTGFWSLRKYADGTVQGCWTCSACRNRQRSAREFSGDGQGMNKRILSLPAIRTPESVELSLKHTVPDEDELRKRSLPWIIHLSSNQQAGIDHRHDKSARTLQLRPAVAEAFSTTPRSDRALHRGHGAYCLRPRQ